jgi:hypothetical protein
MFIYVILLVAVVIAFNVGYSRGLNRKRNPFDPRGWRNWKE